MMKTRKDELVRYLAEGIYTNFDKTLMDVEFQVGDLASFCAEDPRALASFNELVALLQEEQRKEPNTMEKLSSEQVAAVRRRVQLAFGELRKVGFITKSNFSCCMNCAVAELGDIAEKRRRNRAVYWHLQDETHFRKGGSLYIRYCYLPPMLAAISLASSLSSVLRVMPRSFPSEPNRW